MSGDGKRSVAAWPKRPRPSSTLPELPIRNVRSSVVIGGKSGQDMLNSSSSHFDPEQRLGSLRMEWSVILLTKKSRSHRGISATWARMIEEYDSQIPGSQIWHWGSTSQCGAPLRTAQGYRDGSARRASARRPCATDQQHRCRRMYAAA